jgi:hypothetical protein
MRTVGSPRGSRKMSWIRDKEMNLLNEMDRLNVNRRQKIAHAFGRTGKL